MGFDSFNFTSTNDGYRTVLRVGIPKGAYSKKEIKEIYDSIQEQVGCEYLPVIIPNDVTLEIIV